MRIAINFAVRATVMPSLWKELDAEKYAQIILTKPFRVHYSYELNLHFAVGDYQSAYNIISSALLQNKNVKNRIYGRVLLCRICFERGDDKGLKDQLAEIDHHFRYNSDLKIPKHSKEAYEFYRAFSKADYASACAILEKSIETYSKKKNKAYFLLIHQYQFAVTKRMMGDVDEAVACFAHIRERAPKLALSVLAQKQTDYISGTLEEALPERLEVTEAYSLKPFNKAQRVFRLIVLITISAGLLLVMMSEIMIRLDSPKQENKDPEYMAKIESTLYDDYEEYRILGYLSVYTDVSYTVSADSIFLVESDKGVDLHTLYLLNGKDGNHLNVTDIQVDKIYEYENIFSKKITFVLTEKKNDIPENTLYYCEIDGYYFCVISASDME
jgi:tetratricopeptide (TPR) repeat protein